MLLASLFYLSICTCTSLQAEPTDQFKRRDKDRNGILEGQELNGIPTDLLMRLDQNKDGKVSSKEDERLFNQARLRYTVKTFNYAGNQNPRQEIDVLLPRQSSTRPLPCLIFIHGGGWQAGDKRQGHQQLQGYVNSQKYVGVSIGYRLSNETIWPAQLHDCKAAIRFLYANAQKFNIDTARFVVFGTSAGGHLAAAVATTGNNPKLNGNVGHHLAEPSKVAGAISYFGPTDFQRMDDFPCRFKHDAPGSPESRLIGSPIQSTAGKTQAANPITYIDERDPPLICIHGDRDDLVPFNQSELLTLALMKKNVPTALIRIMDGGPGGFLNPEVGKVEAQFFNAILFNSAKFPDSKTLSNRP